MSRDSRFLTLFGAVALAGVGLVAHRLTTQVAAIESAAAAEPARIAPVDLTPAPARSPASTPLPRENADAATMSSVDVSVESAHPFVIEVQGAPHVLARLRTRGASTTIRLQPLDGGAPVWEYVPDEEKRDDWAILYHDEDDALALVTRGFRVTGVEIDSGEARWSTTLSDKVTAIGRRSGKLVVLTRDTAVHEIDPVSGAATPTTGAPAEGERLRSDAYSSPRPELFYDKIVRLDGLQIQSFLCSPGHRRPRTRGFPTQPPCTDTHGLLFAVRNPGTPLPFLVSYDSKTRKERWRRPLSGPTESARMTMSGPSTVWVGDDVIVVHGDRDVAPKIARLALADGAVRWEKTFPADTFTRTSLTLAGDLLLFHDHASLWSLDPVTGDVQHCIGPCAE